MNSAKSSASRWSNRANSPKVRHQYANFPEELEIHFFAAQIQEMEVTPHAFEQVAWVLPKELSQYDFLPANRELIARLATGKAEAGGDIGSRVEAGKAFIGKRWEKPQEPI